MNTARGKANRQREPSRNPSQEHSAKDSRSTRRGLSARRWWPWLMRALKTAFFVAVAWLLISQAQSIAWDKVLTTLRQRPLVDLWLPALLAAASHLLYSCFDLLGKHVTGHRIPVPTVMLVNFISYAFNLNMGSLIGGIAFRYRLYSRLGLSAENITRVVGMSMLSNWLGYVFVAGIVFALWPLPLPRDWRVDGSGLRWLGVLLFVLALAYLLLCALSTRRVWTLRGHAIALPSLRLALLQIGMASLNWLLIGGTIFLLLGNDGANAVTFPSALAVLLIAAIAGVITHVPAGLGVLEAVFIALLADESGSVLLASLLAYRAIYYLLPLALAVVLYAGMELQLRRTDVPARQSARW